LAATNRVETILAQATLPTVPAKYLWRRDRDELVSGGIVRL
jgi:hypothetical protein